jgi:hypothetical protein
MAKNRNRTDAPLSPAEQPLLALAAGSYAERLGTIENLFARLDLDPRKRSLRDVLRWFLDHLAWDESEGRELCLYHAASVTASMWVQCGRRSVRSAVAFWRALGVIRLAPERKGPGGGRVPPRAWIDWATVLLRCGVRDSDPDSVPGGTSAAMRACVAGATGSLPSPLPASDPADPSSAEDLDAGSVPEAEEEYTAEADRPYDTFGGPGAMEAGLVAPFHHADGGPGAMARTPPHPDGGPGATAPSLHGVWISKEHALACARAVVSDSVSVSVVDVDRNSNSDQTSARARVPWAEVKRLAAKAAGIVYGGHAPTSAAARRTYLAAAAMALTLFRTRTAGHWLLAAAEATHERRVLGARTDRRVGDPVRYLVGVLRNNCFTLGGVEPIDDERVARNWFSLLCQPFETAVELHCAPSPPLPPIAGAGDEKTSEKQGPAAEQGAKRDKPEAALVRIDPDAEAGTVATAARLPREAKPSAADMERSRQAQLAALARMTDATARPP